MLHITQEFINEHHRIAKIRYNQEKREARAFVKNAEKRIAIESDPLNKEYKKMLEIEYK
jgi:predicted GH43/DUF377 family glycosyl hydrolase